MHAYLLSQLMKGYQLPFVKDHHFYAITGLHLVTSTYHYATKQYNIYIDIRV